MKAGAQIRRNRQEGRFTAGHENAPRRHWAGRTGAKNHPTEPRIGQQPVCMARFAFPPPGVAEQQRAITWETAAVQSADIPRRQDSIQPVADMSQPWEAYTTGFPESTMPADAPMRACPVQGMRAGASLNTRTSDAGTSPSPSCLHKLASAVSAPWQPTTAPACAAGRWTGTERAR